ncbi:MAG: tetratricopeptide repeat protein, partial [Armatimonadota bacterium]
MTTEGMSPERTRAFYKFKEAEQQASKHHYDQAIGIARDALEIDPTFIEVRHWIVSILMKTEQTRKASLELQTIIHECQEDQAAWDQLRKVDAPAAERLERLHTIAPDPFVVQRTADNAISDDLDDLGGLSGEFVEEAEELIPQPGHVNAFDSLEDIEGTDAVQSLLQDEVGAVPLGAAGSGQGSQDAFDDLDMSEFAEDEEELVPAEEETLVPPAEPEPVATTAPAPTGLKLSDLLYEEDLKYRDRLEQNPIYARLLPKVIDFWKNDEAWDTAISGSVHMDEARHPEIVAVCHEVEAKMNAPRWALYMCPERRMVSTITRGAPPTISLTTGMFNTLSHQEQVFAMGRCSTMVLVGHVAFLQMTTLTLERTPRSITDVEMDMLELLKHEHSGWDAGVHREDRNKLGALCHAWQQRAELTADRGGLVCCGDLEAACNGIAKTVAADSAAAKLTNWKALVEKYKGQDAGQLAAIAPKED